MKYPVMKHNLCWLYPTEMLMKRYETIWNRRNARRCHYVAGNKIKTLDELMSCDRVMFVANGRKGYVIQKGWYQNWQIQMANSWIKKRWLAHAVLIPRNTKRKRKTK